LKSSSVEAKTVTQAPSSISGDIFPNSSSSHPKTDVCEMEWAALRRYAPFISYGGRAGEQFRL